MTPSGEAQLTGGKRKRLCRAMRGYNERSVDSGSLPAVEPRPLPNYTEGEYGTLDLPDGWHVVSLACFALSLVARFLVKLLPAGHYFFPRVLLPGIAVFTLAALGLLCGLLGLRKIRGRGLAKVGVFLNGVVLALAVLATIIFFRIMP